MEAPQLNTWGLPSIQLEFFSGPMDLLYHLVQQREVSIEDVDLAEVCDQYLQIISSAKLIDLEQATEYLVIATTLLAMKCEALLPPNVEAEGEEIDSYDPRFFSELRERLKAYAETKQRGEGLRLRPYLGVDEFTTPPRHDERDTEVVDVSGDGLTLGKIFAQLLKRIGEVGAKYRISMEPISVVSYMMKVVDKMSDVVKSTIGQVTARKRFIDIVRLVGGNEAKDRGVVIGSFIAVLELMKRGVVSADTDETGENFTVEFKLHQLGEDRGGEIFVSEFDAEPSEAGEFAEEKRVQHG